MPNDKLNTKQTAYVHANASDELPVPRGVYSKVILTILHGAPEGLTPLEIWRKLQRVRPDLNSERIYNGIKKSVTMLRPIYAYSVGTARGGTRSKLTPEGFRCAEGLVSRSVASRSQSKKSGFGEESLQRSAPQVAASSKKETDEETESSTSSDEFSLSLGDSTTTPQPATQSKQSQVDGRDTPVPNAAIQHNQQVWYPQTLTQAVYCETSTDDAVARLPSHSILGIPGHPLQAFLWNPQLFLLNRYHAGILEAAVAAAEAPKTPSAFTALPALDSAGLRALSVDPENAAASVSPSAMALAKQQLLTCQAMQQELLRSFLDSAYVTACSAGSVQK